MALLFSSLLRSIWGELLGERSDASIKLGGRSRSPGAGRVLVWRRRGGDRPNVLALL